MATEQRDVGMGKDGLYPTPQLGDDLLLTLESLAEGGAVNVGLGGYAATVEAGAADLVLLDNNYLQALTGGIFSGAVASGPRADDE